MKKILKTVFIFVVVLLMTAVTMSPLTALCEGDEKIITPKYDITEEETIMMQCVLQKELRSSSLEHKLIVAQLMVNRLNSKEFSNTMTKVLKQKGQFGSISNYYDKTHKPDKDTKKAVKKVVDGYKDVTYGAVFYFSPVYCINEKTTRWFRSLNHCLTFKEKMGNVTYIHEFYK